MTEWLLVFGIFLIVVLGMALGVLFGRKPLAGSCGGIANAGINQSCDFCGKPSEDCPRRKNKSHP